jgi:hypothetical protein
LVCKNPKEAGTMITNSQYNANVIIRDRELWSFKIFSTEFFGS